MKEKKFVSGFIKNIFEDDFSSAKSNLQSAVLEKLKNRMGKGLKESESNQKNIKGE